MNIDEIDPTAYRFEALLMAIELFTQRFNTEQLTGFSLDMVSEIMKLQAAALFIRKDDRFVMKKAINMGLEHYVITDSEPLRQVATFRGHIITKELDEILQPEDIAVLQIEWFMPLIIDDKLHGFIVSKRNRRETFSNSDLIMSGALMRLINTSLENSLHLAELMSSNALLDQKNFNLFAINQSTKVLFSELSLPKLHETATDIFSEVTSSRITSFGTVDPLTRRLRISGFRNVTAYTQFHGEFELRRTRYNGPIVLHILRDQEMLKDLFVNFDLFGVLEAEYVVLIVKSEIIAMVTLGKPVNEERQYDDSTFELVESLANSAYISITNAILFKEVNYQRSSALQKLHMLQTMNRLVKNMNECSTPAELCYFTLKTLQLAFGVKKGVICLRTGQDYLVQHAIGFGNEETAGRLIMTTEALREESVEGLTISDYTHEGPAKYLPEEALAWMGEGNCLVLSPLTVTNRVMLDEDPYPLGLLIILETEKSLVEEETVLIQSVAANISPVLHQMRIVAKLKRKLVPDPRQSFFAALQDKITTQEQYLLPFHLFYKHYTTPPFSLLSPVETVRPELPEDVELFAFDGHLFALSYDLLPVDGWVEIPDAHDMEAVKSFPYELLMG